MDSRRVGRHDGNKVLRNLERVAVDGYKGAGFDD